MIERAVEQGNIESQDVCTYTSDVYRLITSILFFYHVSTFFVESYEPLKYLSRHWFLITGLVSLILTFEGIHNTLFGSISAISFGIAVSDVFNLEDGVSNTILSSMIIIFNSAAISARIFRFKNLIIFSGLVFSVIQLVVLFLVTGSYSRIYLILTVGLMLFYVYYNMHAVFNWAKDQTSGETSLKRDTSVAMDAAAILFLGIFMRNN